LFCWALILSLTYSSLLYADISHENKIALHFSLGARNPALNSSTQPWSLSSVYCAGIGYGFSEDVMLFAEFDFSKIYNDTLSDKIFKLGRDDADRYWKIRTFRLKLKYSMIKNSRLIPYLTGGTGVSIWSIHDIISDEKLKVTDGNNDSTEYSATEIFFSGGGGYEWFLHDNLTLNLEAQFNYLIGLGADFSQSVNDNRSHAYGEIRVGITYYFGSSGDKGGYDYDNLKTVISNKQQIELDQDRDGVVNSLDLCPNTPAEARYSVDEYGCPVDSDADGLPDYLDLCPLVYAVLTSDSSGCPPDQDGDMVPDSIDICPDSPRGYAVNKDGCPYLDSIFIKQILHPQYSQSGQALDFRITMTLDSIAAKMLVFPQVKMVIQGYSDNSLNREASLLQTAREAEKIKSYFIGRGISGARLETIGRGATEFVDTNTSQHGRENNHRIEITYTY